MRTASHASASEASRVHLRTAAVNPALPVMPVHCSTPTTSTCTCGRVPGSRCCLRRARRQRPGAAVRQGQQQRRRRRQAQQQHHHSRRSGRGAAGGGRRSITCSAQSCFGRGACCSWRGWGCWPSPSTPCWRRRSDWECMGHHTKCSAPRSAPACSHFVLATPNCSLFVACVSCSSNVGSQSCGQTRGSAALQTHRSEECGHT